MTAKEYLEQMKRLDTRIASDKMELEKLEATLVSISSPQLGDRVQKSASHEAGFERKVWKIMQIREKINQEVDTYVDLLSQTREVISNVRDEKEQLVLRLRYLFDMKWEAIGAEMNVSERSVRRWHSQALRKVELPEDAIVI